MLNTHTPPHHAKRLPHHERRIPIHTRCSPPPHAINGASPPSPAGNMASRTFSDFETISEAMNGICQLYETRLKGLNPGTGYSCFRSKVCVLADLNKTYCEDLRSLRFA